MRAALYKQYGAPEVLYEGTVPLLPRRSGEILVRVHAAGVNSLDLIVRAGTLRLITGGRFPQRTGLDFAGEVVGAPALLSPFRIGDRVWGALPRGQWGSAAEFVSVPMECLALSPKGMSPKLAAALPIVGATALLALREVAKLRPGERLLVRGSSGGVGLAAVQLGRAFGSEVTGLGSFASAEVVRVLGAHRTFNYAETEPSQLGTFDVILDTVGTNLRAYQRLLAPKGRMITVAIDWSRPISSLLYIATSVVFGGRRVRFFGARISTGILRDLSAHVEGGALRPVVDKVYPLSGIQSAHSAMEEGGRLGKQIVTLVHSE